MLTYREKLTRMAKMEYFSHKAFIGDDECPQAVCNLVLALALAHNDLNDIEFGFDLLAPTRPAMPMSRCTEWALHNALALHLVRERAGVVHEIVDLVRENLSVLEKESFRRLCKLLNASQRTSWDAVVSFAHGRAKDTPLGRYLMIVRNKVAFHYDAARIGQGFIKKFAPPAAEPTLVGRGVNANSNRFYFADGAAEEAFFMFDDEVIVRDVATGVNTLFSDLNMAIYHLVTKFIAMRGMTFREYKDDGKIPVRSPLTGSDPAS